MERGLLVRTDSMKYLMVASEDGYYLFDTDILWRGYISPVLNWMSPIKCVEITKEAFYQLEYDESCRRKDGGVLCISMVLAAILNSIESPWIEGMSVFERVLILTLGVILICVVRIPLALITKYRVKSLLSSHNTTERKVLISPAGKLKKIINLLSILVGQFLIVMLFYFMGSWFLRTGYLPVLILILMFFFVLSHKTTFFLAPTSKIRKYNIKVLDDNMENNTYLGRNISNY